MGKEEEYFPHASQTSTDPASIGNCRRCLLRFERLIDNSTLAHSSPPSLPFFSFSHSPLKSPPLLEIGGAAVGREEDATSWCIDGMCTNKLTRIGDPTSATTFITCSASAGLEETDKNLGFWGRRHYKLKSQFATDLVTPGQSWSREGLIWTKIYHLV